MQKIRNTMAYLTKIIRTYWIGLLAAGISFLLVLCIPISYTFVSTQGSRYDLSRVDLQNLPSHKVAIIFGAGVQKDGTPTPYLRSRIETGVRLYKAHRVERLLMSGDNSTKHYNEPVAMRRYAMQLGMPAQVITLDYAGFNTYDTCYRARAIFGLQDATLVSQGYHLPRAMETCKGLGIQNVGVAAVHPSRDFTVSYLIREVLSTDKMVIQLAGKPRPTVLGHPESIH